MTSCSGWSSDSKAILFSSNRGEDFMPQLYLVSTEGGMPWKAGTDMGVQASYSPDGQKLAYNQKRKSTGASITAARIRATL
jgi:tricorn protease